MDPYLILGVPRNSTREQVKAAFRARAHQAHPDRGGDGEAFVELCKAYRRLLEDFDQNDAPPVEGPIKGHPKRDPGNERDAYVEWLDRLSKNSRRAPVARWWMRHPALARATLFGLIGLSGVLVVCAAVALGMRGPGQTTRSGRGPERPFRGR